MLVTSFSLHPPFASLSGLNDTAGSQLWYWFIAADSANWQSMPTVAWYQGGPGGSSLYGWFQENISPYGFSQNLTITDNPYRCALACYLRVWNSRYTFLVIASI